MKSLKYMWEKELESKMPMLDQSIIDEPIPQNEASEIKRKRPILKYISFASSIAAVIVLCICIIPLLNKKAPEEKGTLITVEINPRVIFISSNEGVVTDVIATNKDADIVISSQGFEEDVINQKTPVAIVNYVEYATKLGFIDPDKSENAVKITACDDKENTAVLKEVKKSLETHFKKKGVYAVVIDNVATVKKICEINEIGESERIEDIVSEFKGKSPLYQKRQMEDMSEDELLKQYKESIISDNLKNEAREGAKDIKLLLELKEMNEKIKELTGYDYDYWRTSEDKGKISKEAKELINQMEQGLKEISEKYKLQIDGVTQLLSLTESFSKEAIDGMLDRLEKGESFDDVEDLKKIFESLGKDTTEIDKVINMPQSKEEILKETEDKIKEESNNRIESNRECYEKPREEIGSKDYNSYVDGMKGEKGENKAPHEEKKKK